METAWLGCIPAGHGLVTRQAHSPCIERSLFTHSWRNWEGLSGITPFSWLGWGDMIDERGTSQHQVVQGVWLSW